MRTGTVSCASAPWKRPMADRRTTSARPMVRRCEADMSISLTLTLLPGQNKAFGDAQKCCHQGTEHADQKHADQHMAGLEIDTTCLNHVTEPRLRRDQLGRYHRHPGLTETDAQAGPYRGQGGRKINGTDKAPAVGAEKARGVDMAR